MYHHQENPSDAAQLLNSQTLSSFGRDNSTPAQPILYSEDLPPHLQLQQQQQQRAIAGRRRQIAVPKVVDVTGEKVRKVLKLLLKNLLILNKQMMIGMGKFTWPKLKL